MMSDMSGISGRSPASFQDAISKWHFPGDESPGYVPWPLQGRDRWWDRFPPGLKPRALRRGPCRAGRPLVGSESVRSRLGVG